ncbi:alkyl hydroperoxide reductase AhpD [Thermopolyspora flexuosa]|jgi:AhpD family alkylhydroperoxidase|uniref:AhpD family alkylhydroperoxidase n=1 Tax=Thermopolyspora flexuosa TaxID=103836 RepID=A0A543IS17_9ACTN|nr:carboxymuconolactone decarboxylase family protein [Thermopolyspora flexuosa]TQM73368.1 AhpD family alkylhydroperoxidase [Thermopolyspora flexuosa]GGM80527.1 alkyl hydroperoxide reductase AhpD [Thermopolyspora flexuosa]
MTARMNIAELEPGAYQAMLGLEKYLSRSTLPKSLRYLVELRASQINGCAYCVDMHSRQAKAEGESDARLHAVAVWREAPFFDERERAALELTEAATRLSDGHGVPDDVWQQAAKHFDEHELAQLVVLIATINAWNRIGVTTHMVPESYKG